MKLYRIWLQAKPEHQIEEKNVSFTVSAANQASVFAHVYEKYPKHKLVNIVKLK